MYEICSKLIKKDTKTIREVCSKFTMKAPEQVVKCIQSQQ